MCAILILSDCILANSWGCHVKNKKFNASKLVINIKAKLLI